MYELDADTLLICFPGFGICLPLLFGDLLLLSTMGVLLMRVLGLSLPSGVTCTGLPNTSFFCFFLLRCQLVIISCTAFLWFITLHLWCRLVIIFSTAIHWFIACRLRCSLVIFFSATLLWFIAFLLWCRFVMILYIAFLWCIVFHLWCRLIMIFSTAFLWCISFQLRWRFRTYIFCCYNLHMPFYFSLPVLSLKLLPRLPLCFWHLLSLLLSSMNSFLQFSPFLFAERWVSIHSKSEREQKPHYILFC